MPKAGDRASAASSSHAARAGAVIVAVTGLLASAAAAQAADRTAYVVNQLTLWNSGLPAAVRNEKYAAMETDLFAFFRGSNHLFWKDHGTASALSTYGNVGPTRIWLQGDMHVDNLGAFANDKGTIVYDLNDFDEAVLGDYQLDLWRMGVSLVLLMRRNGGFSAAQEAAVVDACTESYLDAVENWRSSSGEAAKTYTASDSYGQLDDFLAGVAASRSKKKLLDKYTAKNSSGVRFLDPAVSADLQAVAASTVTALSAQMASYGSTLSGGLSYSPSFFKIR